MVRFVVDDTQHATRDAAILDIVHRNDYVNVTCREYPDAESNLLREWHVTDIDDGDLRILAVFNPEYRASVEDLVRRKPALRRAIEAKGRFDEQTSPTSRSGREKQCLGHQQAPKEKRWWARLVKACRSHCCVCCVCCVPSTEAFAPASGPDSPATSMPDLASRPYTSTTYSVPQPYLANFA